ncbi:energy transducer TonB [Flavobacterium sp. MC2016-06]|jgi:protein TonB|uniref:energy transducer TonB n=1 Tax=Flavobacterium sp. MC2016-06 TaxID=2676308 RepID=UPI0012BAF6E9|nr:energy transducer TonB [Flavobacterium sp. MC2016-06]MBU3860225.1 energy transducer TonB [Flavobacterium sp. MC2016-06]
MKKFLILILICLVQNISSQTIKEDSKTEIPSNELFKSQEVKGPDYIYNTAAVEIKPEFPGEQQALDKFIKENYKNPKDKTLKGNVYLTFIIEKDGSLSDIKVLRDIGSVTGSEAIRVLKTSPNWIPGKQNNNVVRTLYSLPISINNFLK